MSMKKHFLFAVLLLFSALVMSCVATFGQPAGELRSSEVDVQPLNVQALKDSIREYDEQLGFLQHFLEVSTVDSRHLQHTDLRCWTISNPALRDSLFFTLMQADSSLQSEAGAEAEVLATASDDLIEVRFGNAVFKGMTLRTAIDQSESGNLYRKVAESYNYSRDVELRDPAFRLKTEFNPELLSSDDLVNRFAPVTLADNPHPVDARADVSLYGLIFRIAPTWGGEIRIGNDEIGFPFWSSGKATFLATYKDVKFGFELPLHAGLQTYEFFPPFILRSRKLNGTRGIVGEFDFGSVGGKFSFTRLTENDTDALTDPDKFFYITGIVQAYFSFGLSLTETNLIRAKVGGGAHRVNEARLESVPAGSGVEERIVPGLHTDILSPYLKFEYISTGLSEQFGASVQFYDMTLLTTASLEIVPNVLTLEMKYMWPLVSDLPEWQNPEFFIISPHVRISF